MSHALRMIRMPQAGTRPHDEALLQTARFNEQERQAVCDVIDRSSRFDTWQVPRPRLTQPNLPRHRADSPDSHRVD